MKRTMVVVMAALLFAFSLQAAVPEEINFQGRLTDTGGSPIDTTVNIDFILYDAETGGSSVWAGTHASVAVSGGLFSVVLGQAKQIDAALLSGSAELWLAVNVESDGEMSPRFKVVSAPYAILAAEAETLGSVQESDVTTLQSQVSTLQTQMAAQDARLAALEAKLASVTIEGGGNDFVFTGVNVHVRSGSGATAGAVNGRGNLIVGYNENGVGAPRTGSHNMVVGRNHGYTSYGCFVAGYENFVMAPYASVLGGYSNVANGDRSSVSGGYSNIASGLHASVSGGAHNEAANDDSSVSGGLDNTANGVCSHVSGGELNTANGTYSVVSGGLSRTVSTIHDWRAGTLFQTE